MSAVHAHDSTLRDEPDVREIAGVYVLSTRLDQATAEVLSDPDLTEKVQRRRLHGMDRAILADELDLDSVDWGED